MGESICCHYSLEQTTVFVRGGGCETARDEVQTIWQAAEEGFAEVLAMVRNYREELKGMRGEACARSFVWPVDGPKKWRKLVQRPALSQEG